MDERASDARRRRAPFRPTLPATDVPRQAPQCVRRCRGTLPAAPTLAPRRRCLTEAPDWRWVLAVRLAVPATCVSVWQTRLYYSSSGFGRCQVGAFWKYRFKIADSRSPLPAACDDRSPGTPTLSVRPGLPYVLFTPRNPPVTGDERHAPCESIEASPLSLLAVNSGGDGLTTGTAHANAEQFRDRHQDDGPSTRAREYGK